MKTTNLLKILNLVALNGGVTYNLNTGESNPDWGYTVSLGGFEKISNVLDNDVLLKYVKTNSIQLSKSNVYLGIWLKGDYYLDCSVVIEDKETAIRTAMLNDQLAIWDNKKNDEIEIPLSQKCGTETQKRTFIDLTAGKMAQNL